MIGIRRVIGLIAIAGLAACGSSGGGSSPVNNPSGGSSSWTPNMFLPADSFAAQCQIPRSGNDPGTGLPYPDLQGTTLAENNWLRSWSNDLYLWYDEIADRDPGSFTTPAYFDLLKTTAMTPSGNPKDKFHFSIPTDEWRNLSQSGVTSGYGAEWVVVSSTPPRQIVVAYTQPNSPAAAANLERGATVLEIDGVDIVNATDQAGIATLNSGLFPSQAGESHTFTIRDAGAAATRSVTMQSEIITLEPVQSVATLPTATGNVGYILFNEHIATAEQALIDAVDQLQSDNIVDLVLDVRYNGGGFLVLASELAYMIAGPVPTAGQTFEEIQFNDKHPSTNPVTGIPLTPLGFQTTAFGLSATQGTPLPTLDLPRVFVLTGPNTCSASESIINSLRGVDVEVIQIGTTTCGKPYGFYAADNCGTTYFSIQFRGVNAKNFGDYTDGFSPSNTLGTAGTPLPGCSVADDYTKALGDPTENRLAAALQYRVDQSCPAPTAMAVPGLSKPTVPLSSTDGLMHRSPSRENRILNR